jgi:hypothetical protein
LGQGVLNVIADLKVRPKIQYPLDFGVTLHNNVPQETGGISVGGKRMTLQGKLDYAMHDRENKVADGQFRKRNPRSEEIVFVGNKAWDGGETHAGERPAGGKRGGRRKERCRWGEREARTSRG